MNEETINAFDEFLANLAAMINNSTPERTDLKDSIKKLRDCLVEEV